MSAGTGAEGAEADFAILPSLSLVPLGVLAFLLDLLGVAAGVWALDPGDPDGGGGMYRGKDSMSCNVLLLTFRSAFRELQTRQEVSERVIP